MPLYHITLLYSTAVFLLIKYKQYIKGIAGNFQVIRPGSKCGLNQTNYRPEVGVAKNNYWGGGGMSKKKFTSKKCLTCVLNYY